MQIPENFTNALIEEEENAKKKKGDGDVEAATKLDTSDKENDSPAKKDSGKKMKFMLSGFDDEEKNR